jgi:hypothetical protein
MWTEFICFRSMTSGMFIVNVLREIRILKNAGNFLPSLQPVSSSRKNFYGDSYFELRDVSADTPVNESGTLCVVRVDNVCFKKNRSEESSKYCRI